MAVVTALYNPLPIFLPDDLSDVMSPDHDRANGWAARVSSIVCP